MLYNTYTFKDIKQTGIDEFLKLGTRIKNIEQNKREVLYKWLITMCNELGVGLIYLLTSKSQNIK